MQIPFHMIPDSIRESDESSNALAVEDFYGMDWGDIWSRCLTHEEKAQALRFFRRGYFYVQLCPGESFPDDFVRFAEKYPHRLGFSYGGTDRTYGLLTLTQETERWNPKTGSTEMINKTAVLSDDDIITLIQ